MKTKKEILEILSTEGPYLYKRYGVKSLGLFGSYARGEECLESDIDLLVAFDKPVGFFKFIEIEDYLSAKLGAKVELVTEDALKSLIRPNVMEDIVYV